MPASPLRNAFTLVVKSTPFKPSLPVNPLSPAAPPVPSAVLPSRPSEAVLPILPALSIVLRVSASKPIVTAPFSPVVIVIPFFVVSAFVVADVAPVAAVVPVPATKLKPSFNLTVLISVPVAPFARYVIEASKFFTVTIASPKLTVPGSAFLVTTPASFFTSAVPAVIVIVFVPFLMTRSCSPSPEIPFILVKVSANFTTKPFALVVGSFSTRMLMPAVASVAGVKLFAPLTVNVSPRLRCTEAVSSPTKFMPAVLAALTFVSVYVRASVIRASNLVTADPTLSTVCGVAPPSLVIVYVGFVHVPSSATPALPPRTVAKALRSACN